MLNLFKFHNIFAIFYSVNLILITKLNLNLLLFIILKYIKIIKYTYNLIDINTIFTKTI